MKKHLFSAAFIALTMLSISNTTYALQSCETALNKDETDNMIFLRLFRNSGSGEQSKDGYAGLIYNKSTGKIGVGLSHNGKIEKTSKTNLGLLTSTIYYFDNMPSFKPLEGGSVSSGNTGFVTGDQVYNTINQIKGVTYKAGSDINIASDNAISVNKGGQVASGNTGIITGGAVYNAIQDVKNNIKTYKAGSDISIASDNSISVAKNGQIANGNTGIVTGDTVYKTTNTLATRLSSQETKLTSNLATLNNLSDAVSGLSNTISTINTNVANSTKSLASGITSRLQNDMGNLNEDGKTVIRDLIKETLKSYNSNTSSSSTSQANTVSPVSMYRAPIVQEDSSSDAVTSKDIENIQTELGTKVNKTDFNALKDTVDSNTDKIAKNTESISANTTAISDLKTGKADKDGSNIDVDGFTKKLGIGAIEKDNANLVTGGTVFTALEQKADYDYVNAGFNMMQGQMQSMQQRLTQDINRVGAGAAALAGLHPQDYDPDNKLDFAAGYGHYKNANATALGIFYRPNAVTTVSLSGTIGNGDPMISAGLSFKLGMGKNVEKVLITKEKYDAQQAENKEMKEKIHELEVALQSMMNK